MGGGEPDNLDLLDEANIILLTAPAALLSALYNVSRHILALIFTIDLVFRNFHVMLPFSSVCS